MKKILSIFSAPNLNHFIKISVALKKFFVLQFTLISLSREAQDVQGPIERKFWGGHADFSAVFQHNGGGSARERAKS